MEGTITAPFTMEQVVRLNEFQHLGIMHEFTCPHPCKNRTLIATLDGWVCPCGEYRQYWAHGFMLKTEELKNQIG